MTEVNLKQLVTLTDQVKAEMINDALKDKGIDCVMQSTASHSVHPFTVDGLAEIKILVDSKNLEKAREIVNNFGFEKTN